jgi:parvulin-like peptidyl-prolyl isomerase
MSAASLVTDGSLTPVMGLDWSGLRALAEANLLRPYLRQCLIAQALGDEQLNEDERNAALGRFAQEHQLADLDAVERYRQHQVFSPQALAYQVELPLRLQRHCQRHYRAKAEARFLERKQHLDRVVYSLLRLQDGGLARELYLQLQEGEATFADLAARYAEGPEQATRGIVGPVPLTQAHPQLVARLRSAPVGVTQEPFQIDQWWLLVRLESLTAATFDDAMAQQMGQELFEQWLEQSLEAQLEQLRPRLLAPIPPAQPQ